jgi:hypothetical protein
MHDRGAQRERRSLGYETHKPPAKGKPAARAHPSKMRLNIVLLAIANRKPKVENRFADVAKWQTQRT